MLGVNRSSAAPTRGPLHQETSQAKRADSTTVPVPRKPSCQESQRRRETDCVHARRCVPASTSLATRGAPQKTPMRPGATRKSGTRCLGPRSPGPAPAWWRSRYVLGAFGAGGPGSLTKGCPEEGLDALVVQARLPRPGHPPGEVGLQGTGGRGVHRASARSEEKITRTRHGISSSLLRIARSLAAFLYI